MPGKFEGQPEYVEHFYAVWGEGGEDGSGGDVEEAGAWAVFTPTLDEVARFPELQGRGKIVLVEDQQGFVSEFDVVAASSDGLVVIETSSDFIVRYLETGKEAHMGDGVDMFEGVNVGTRRFYRELDKWLRHGFAEIVDAYRLGQDED